MPEYRLSIRLRDGRSVTRLLFALDDDEAVRRSAVFYDGASSVEVRSGDRLVADLEVPDAPALFAHYMNLGNQAHSPSAPFPVERPFAIGDSFRMSLSLRRNRMVLALLLTMFLSLSMLAGIGWLGTEWSESRQLSGAATIIDGGSLVIDGQMLSLSGIEVPEIATPEGQAAYRAALGLTEGRDVTCQITEDRTAACSVNGTDLAEALIETGVVRRIE